MAFRTYKECLQFQNGNLNLRIGKEDLEEFKKDQVLFLSDLLSWLDCSFIGETFNLNNWETGHIIYNSYMDCWYVFNWKELNVLANGYSLKLEAINMNDAIREMVRKENL